jgi:hypothetical protein
MAIILKANKVNLFVSSVLFVFWYHSPNFLDTPRITPVYSLRGKCAYDEFAKYCNRIWADLGGQLQDLHKYNVLVIIQD